MGLLASNGGEDESQEFEDLLHGGHGSHSVAAFGFTAYTAWEKHLSSLVPQARPARQLASAEKNPGRKAAPGPQLSSQLGWQVADDWPQRALRAQSARQESAGVAVSPLRGPMGNREFLVHLRPEGGGDASALIDNALARAPTDEE